MERIDTSRVELTRVRTACMPADDATRPMLAALAGDDDLLESAVGEAAANFRCERGLEDADVTGAAPAGADSAADRAARPKVR